MHVAGRSLSSRGGDRFARLDWYRTATGEVLISGASAWLDCEVEREIRAGDHEIVLLRVHALDTTRPGPRWSSTQAATAAWPHDRHAAERPIRPDAGPPFPAPRPDRAPDTAPVARGVGMGAMYSAGSLLVPAGIAENLVVTPHLCNKVADRAAGGLETTVGL